jgi:hypothetical protein
MTDENTASADELASVRAHMRVLQRREAELRAGMLSDPDARVGKRFVVSVKSVTQRRIDSDRLRRDYPAIAEAVTERTTIQQLFLSGLTEDGEIIPLARSVGLP